MSNNNTTQAIDFTSILINLTAHRSNSRALEEMGLEDNEANHDRLNSFLSRWDKADCDEEGPTKEQDKNLDSIIEEAVAELQA